MAEGRRISDGLRPLLKDRECYMAARDTLAGLLESKRGEAGLLARGALARPELRARAAMAVGQERLLETLLSALDGLLEVKDGKD